jgi:hypothetical protein
MGGLFEKREGGNSFLLGVAMLPLNEVRKKGLINASRSRVPGSSE